MIEKVTHSGVLSGVSSPLLPLIYADFEFNNTGTDGVYVQTTDKNEIVTVFSLKNSCVTLTALNGIVDLEELNEFFSFLSVESVLCDCSIFPGTEKVLPLLWCETTPHSNNDVLKLDEYSRLSDYKSVYDLLSENGSNFSEWFAVTSKKINNKKSVAVYKCENEIPVSVAIATAIYNQTAIISGVFTLGNCRKKGYASQCVSALLIELSSMGVKPVYLWCEEENLQFYEKLGFTKVGNVFVREDF